MFNTAPDSHPLTLAINDLAVWHSRVMTRMFYPHEQPAVANLTLPATITELDTRLQISTVIDPAEFKHAGKMILIVRDAGAALAAEALTGHVPSYDAYAQFQKYYVDLLILLRGFEMAFLAETKVETQVFAAQGDPTLAMTIDTELTPLQQLLLSKIANAKGTPL